MKMFSKLSTLAFLLAFTGMAYATDIGAPTTGFFANIGAMMQEFVDFFEGPFGLFVSIAALAIAASIWAFAPRGDEGMGRIFRVIMAVLLIVNIPALVIALSAV